MCLFNLMMKVSDFQNDQERVGVIQVVTRAALSVMLLKPSPFPGMQINPGKCTFQPIWQRGKEGAMYTKLKKSSFSGWERCQRIPELTFYT